MKRYASLKSFKHAQKSFTYVAETLTRNSTTKTWHLIMDCDNKTISQFPTLVAAHQPEVCGPPVGRGPQVENRWPIQMQIKFCIILFITKY